MSEDEAHKQPAPKFDHHPRAERMDFWSDTSTCYTRYKYMTVMAGPAADSPKRVQRLESKIPRSNLEKQVGYKMVCYVPVLMPTMDEKFLWVDLTYPLRGIYVPRMQNAHPKAAGYCTFDRIELRLGPSEFDTYEWWKGPLPKGDAKLDVLETVLGGVKGKWCKVKPPPGSHPEPDLPEKYRKELAANGMHPAPMTKGKQRLANNEQSGWDFQPGWTARFNIFRMIHVMVLPNRMLNDEFKNPWKCIDLFECKSVQANRRTLGYIDIASNSVADMVNVLGKENGISLEYRSTLEDKTFMFDALNGIVQVGLSMIPMIGPLVVLSESLLYDYIKDPERFVASWKDAKSIVSRVPAFTGAMAGSAVNCRGFVNDIGGKGSIISGAKPSMAKLPVEQGERKRVFIGDGKEGGLDGVKLEKEAVDGTKADQGDALSIFNEADLVKYPAVKAFALAKKQ
ncbi:hypothetical protein IMZ48_26280 [Candidatus Bathyarchaeota archaeon]|nr:hypothetical protein [Candidatus Bathyarchaeota archaeon]